VPPRHSPLTQRMPREPFRPLIQIRILQTALAAVIWVAPFAIAAVGCRSKSSATNLDSTELAARTTTTAQISPIPPPGVWYARTESGSQTFGWLIRLDSGNTGTLFVGDRPVRICSLVRSDTGLTFNTAPDGGKSYNFGGKYVQGRIVGELGSSGPGTQTVRFGVTQLVSVDTGTASQPVFEGHTGFYSTLYFHPQTGDALGSELILLVAGGKRALLFQQPEGQKSILESGNNLEVAGDTLKFSLGHPPDARHLSITFKPKSVVLHDPDAVDPPSAAHEVLPRKMSLERFVHAPANGTCSKTDLDK